MHRWGKASNAPFKSTTIREEVHLPLRKNTKVIYEVCESPYEERLRPKRCFPQAQRDKILRGLNATLHCLVVVGTIFVTNMSQFVIINVRGYREAHCEEHQESSRKCRKGAADHTCSLLATARSHGASTEPIFP